MLEQTEHVRVGGGVVELALQAVEHGLAGLGVHVDDVEALGQLLLVLRANHFEEIQMP